jgi:predicted DNA-binding protein (UPF0251 family)
MPRPKCQRQIAGLPVATYFKPRGIPMADLEEVVLTIDEVEAIRLADFEGLYQEQAAEKMQISRPTFGRVIASAHRKIADALVTGKALRIEGGVIAFVQSSGYRCISCKKTWAPASGTGTPDACPSCGSQSVDSMTEPSLGGKRKRQER